VIETDTVDSEDPRAWMAFGIYRVAEGIWRIPLPLPIRDLSDVNFYVLADGRDVILVDPGWADPETQALVLDVLAQLGFTIDDVRLIVSTHNHWDHYSAAIELRRTHGFELSLGAGERDAVEAYIEATVDGLVPFFPVQARKLARSGADELGDIIATLPQEEYERNIAIELPDHWLADRQVVTLGERELTMYATPGHTRGHVVIADWARGVMMTGDHVLPRITPSVGLEFDPEPSPLRSFLASLRLMLELPDAMMLPAHGNVTSSVHARVHELLAHHEQRLNLVRDLVASGDRTAWEVAGHMTWTRRQHELRELQSFHQMSAVLEVVAHLDVLAEQGRVIQQSEGELELYSVA
jgi:glyoxylase-like metal-dependent hydrolase (beta-lactamase superfamily II)